VVQTVVGDMLIALGGAMGIQPVVTAIIGLASWRLGEKAIKDYHSAAGFVHLRFINSPAA